VRLDNSGKISFNFFFLFSAGTEHEFSRKSAEKFDTVRHLFIYYGEKFLHEKLNEIINV